MDVLVLNAGADTALPSRTELLRSAGFAVVQAGSGAETLAALRSDPLPTVLVVGTLRDMDVLEVFRLVRAEPRTALIKVLHVAPAAFDAAYHRTCLEQGANLVMADATATEVLVAQIRALGSWATRSNAVLEESEARFRLISDATPLGIAIVDLARGTFLFTNPACEASLGYGRGRLRGRRAADVFWSPAEGEELLARIAANGFISNVEARLKRADGSIIWGLGSAKFLRFGGAPAAIAVVSDVTERKRIEQALHESEQRFRLALRHAPVSVAVQDRDLRYVWAFNEPSARHAAIMGLGDEDLVPADQAARLTALKRRVLQEGIELREQLWLDRPGARVFLDALFEPIRDNDGNIVGVGTAAVNLTGMKLAEQALLESRERYEAIVALAPFAIALLDTEQRIVEANDAAEEMFGITRRDAFGRTPPELGRLEARDLDALYAQLAEHGCVKGVELRYRNGRGEHRLGEFSMSHVTIQGQSYFLGTATDVTTQRRAERDLQHANALLEDSDRRKDEFIAILSHELRNPLAPIRYALPLLHPAEDDEAGKRAVGVIHRQVDQLTRLVDDLLDVSRISGGIIDLQREHRRLEAIVATAIEAAMPAISAARHTLDVDMPHVPLVVFGDPARLSQVVTNLLNNSARYTSRGGRITLTARREGERDVVIEVRDTGMGIPSEALPHIFEMFRQVERPDRTQGGLGVGLALVKKLVEMHGGTVKAESPGIGRGAVFTVRLPIAVPSPPAEPVEPVEASAPPRGSVPPMRVLIVDDSADLVEMLSLAVEGAGHEVRKALDGQSAVSAALSFQPHVVLLDLGLPVLNGLQVATELRRHPETANAWLVALTGWGQAEDRRHTRDAGFDYHLTKPTDPFDVQRLLGDLVGKSR